MLTKLLQGVFIGVTFTLPGLSAGTVILILGFYYELLDDLSRMNLKPYLPHMLGAASGALAGIYAISYLLVHYNAILTSFLLGMLLASVPVVIKHRQKGKLTIGPLILGGAGFIITWFIVGDPTTTFTVLPPGGYFHFFLGGSLASATMLLPGVSGSSVLIIMNLYDDVIHVFSNWEWQKLAFLTAGFAVGIFGLARLLSALYRRYNSAITFLLTGLIIGSARALLPTQFTISGTAATVTGFLLVLYFAWQK
ncbi:MAG TPA: DUF368 domain-containing protein [Candidatus Limnocylindrales bacterium]|nr:DUF368 domain-containing protein [Candidatus Limnocylindrales bacterium]